MEHEDTLFKIVRNIQTQLFFPIHHGCPSHSTWHGIQAWSICHYGCVRPCWDVFETTQTFGRLISMKICQNHSDRDLSQQVHTSRLVSLTVRINRKRFRMVYRKGLLTIGAMLLHLIVYCKLYFIDSFKSSTSVVAARASITQCKTHYFLKSKQAWLKAWRNIFYRTTRNILTHVQLLLL